MEQEHNEQQEHELLSFEELLSAPQMEEEPQEPEERPTEERFEPEEEPPKPKSVKKPILITVTAVVTALALIIGAVFWLRPETPDPAPTSDDGYYLLTKITEYYADGTPGKTQFTYRYDQRGFPVYISRDMGYASEEIWNDKLEVFETIFSAFDGKPEMEVEFVYNEKGDILYRLETQSTYDEKGDLVSCEINRGNQHQNHIYYYGLDGKIDYVEYYSTDLDGHTDEFAGNLKHHYDEAGRLQEVFLIDGRTDSYVFDFRYDEEGRLTLASNRPREGLFYDRYQYDDAGRLVEVRSQYAPGSQMAYIDQECVNYLEYGIAAEPVVQGRTVFTYDSEGRLLSRCCYTESEELYSRTDCEYENGQLSRAIYSQDSQKTVYRFAEEGNGQDITLVRDAYGNIIRQIRPDGCYIEYEYQRFDLSEEEIQRSKNAVYVANHVDQNGESVNPAIPSYQGGHGFVADISYPTTDLYEIDLLRNRYTS